MTNQQKPVALRLAEEMEHDPGINRPSVAAELRRLHAENVTLQQGYDAARLEIDSLQARVQELGAMRAQQAATVDVQATHAMREAVAKVIYDQWVYKDGWVSWVNRGNSLRQDDARRLANLAFAMAQASAQTAVQQVDAEDAARMDWLEQQIHQSHTCVSFDYGRSVDGGIVSEKGYRFMNHRLLCDRMPTLRTAIDAARTQQEDA